MLLRIVFILLCGAASWANNVPIVYTSLGHISGYYKHSFEGRVFSAFEGIPYAQPPVGDLRFEPPRSSTSWSEILNASTLYTCEQKRSEFMPLSGHVQEDCLYLNVYVPKLQPSTNDNYDVIVNIHGGGFMMGDSALAGPGYIMDRDVVYVNLNYRLGVLGFLSTENDVLPGNNGLKDQQLALKWVQTHIKQFGGNPKSVTLMGLSAGGASVHFHYFSPQSKGLFHRGISQSGTALMPWALQEGALRKTRKLSTALKCQDSNLKDLINCLKEVPAEAIAEKTKDFYYINQQFPNTPFAPVVEVETDSAFLTKHPYEQLKDGDVRDVPWLSWITQDEGLLATIYVEETLDEVDKNWEEWSQYLLDYDNVLANSNKVIVAREIKSFYFQDEKISRKNIKSLCKLFGDRYFNIAFEMAVEMQSKVNKFPVYGGVYAFNKTIGFVKLLGSNLEGVAHGDDTILIHDYIGFGPKMHGRKLSKPENFIKNLLLDFIVSFAKDGKPQASGVLWEPIVTNSSKYLLISDLDDVKMVENSKPVPREFWEKLNFLENGRVTLLRDEL